MSSCATTVSGLRRRQSKNRRLDRNSYGPLWQPRRLPCWIWLGGGSTSAVPPLLYVDSCGGQLTRRRDEVTCAHKAAPATSFVWCSAACATRQDRSRHPEGAFCQGRDRQAGVRGEAKSPRRIALLCFRSWSRSRGNFCSTPASHGAGPLRPRRLLRATSNRSSAAREAMSGPASGTRTYPC